MDSTEIAEALVMVAQERGCSVKEMLDDWSDADGWFRKIEGRSVLNRDGGTPALADSVNEWLCGSVERTDTDKARLRRELLRESGIGADEVGGVPLAGVVALIGKRKQAKRVLESWSQIKSNLRPTGL